MRSWSESCAGRIFPANALDSDFIREAFRSPQGLLQYGNLSGVIQIVLNRAMKHHIERMIFSRSDFVQLILGKFPHGGMKARAAIAQMLERALPRPFRRFHTGGQSISVLTSTATPSARCRTM